MKIPNKERLLLWVEALESGDYQQGRNALRNDANGKSRYCCLGVACEVAMKHGLPLFISSNSDGNIAYDHKSGYLPHAVLRWYGLTIARDVEISSDGPGTIFASTANDVLGWSFLVIAEAIRLHYELGERPGSADSEWSASASPSPWRGSSSSR